jgi:monovalent cation/hydrogen antiporter
MNAVTLVLLLFALTTTLSLYAVRLRIPYPTAMVIAGLLIGIAVYCLPHLETFSIRLNPDVLFTAILPPLLYAAAWVTSWNEFRANLRPIVMLSTGAVVFTTLGIAAIAMWLIPGLTWPMAFVLGAIVSPPDAVAATAVTERLRIPKRIVAILDGESLVNDATALVIYRFALAAAMGGAFSLSHALLQFPIVAGGGILIGLLLAFIMHQIHERIEQPLIETAITLLTPYAAYIAAEHLHTSGVLAVVTCGLVLSRHAPHLFSPQTRLTAIALWNFLTFMLNGLVFILIGLQLPTILHTLRSSATQPLLYAAVICVSLIILRLLWTFPGAYLPRLIPSIRQRDPFPPARHVFLVGWVGMRGVVSLAAALALPVTLKDSTAPLPGRDMVLFLTFAVILFTLVFQSLTLPAVVKLLKIEAPKEDECKEGEARRRALTAAMEALTGHPDSHATTAIRSLYTHRLEHLTACTDTDEADPEELLLRATIKAQRKVLVELRDIGQITDELLRKMERELDLEESRLG